MPKTIISDTSCFIVLTKIEELDLLHKVYGQIATTWDIANEFGEKPPYWIDIKMLRTNTGQQLLEMQIDKGESNAIALALETPESTLILDDYKARRIAEELHIPYTGTVGVIVKSKRSGLIPSIKPMLDKIRQTDFRISMDIEIRALKEANE